MKCQRCGGPAPVDGETYRHFWPCGCAVTPDRVYSECYRETIWYSHGLGIWQSHPTREGAIAAWRAALGPYQAPVTVNLTPPTLPTPAEIGRAVRDAEARGDRYLDGAAPPRPTLAGALGVTERDARTMVELNRAEPLRPHQAQTAEIMSTVGCPCGVCGTWAVVYRDPMSATSTGRCLCDRDWHAWDRRRA